MPNRLNICIIEDQQADRDQTRLSLPNHNIEWIVGLHSFRAKLNDLLEQQQIIITDYLLGRNTAEDIMTAMKKLLGDKKSPLPIVVLTAGLHSIGELLAARFDDFPFLLGVIQKGSHETIQRPGIQLPQTSNLSELIVAFRNAWPTEEPTR